MDVLRREAGLRNSRKGGGKRWSRLTWWLLVVVAVGALGFGTYGLLLTLGGTHTTGRVESCIAYRHYQHHGGVRISYQCAVEVADGRTTHITFGSDQSPGDEVDLLLWNGSYHDPGAATASLYAGFGVGLLLLGLVWWSGYPPARRRAAEPSATGLPRP